MAYYDDLVGKEIKIISLADESKVVMARYSGKTGLVTFIGTDPWGDIYLSGTWGGINIYPKVDKFEIIKK